MSTEESVAHPEASSIPGPMSALFAFRPHECLRALVPAVATVEDISRWISELAELAERETLPDVHVATEVNAIMRRVIDAANEVAWDLDLVVDALRAAQKGG